MRRVSFLLILSMLPASTSGCYWTWDVAPRELAKLDGYRPPSVVPLADVRGETFTFDKTTKLRLEEPEAATVRGPFTSIDVRGPILTGTTTDHPPWGIDLGKVTSLEARKFSPEKTVALGLGLAATVGAVVLLAWALAPHPVY